MPPCRRPHGARPEHDADRSGQLRRASSRGRPSAPMRALHGRKAGMSRAGRPRARLLAGVTRRGTRSEPATRARVPAARPARRGRAPVPCGRRRQPMMIRMMKLTAPTVASVQVAELLADLAFDLETGDGGADEPQLEVRTQRRGVGADARCHDAGIGRAADDDRVRSADDGGTALHWSRQVACVEVLPLGDLAGAARDRPVDLGLRAAAVVATGEVDRPAVAPSGRVRAGHREVRAVVDGPGRRPCRRSGSTGSPSAAALPNSPRWTAPTGPFASLPPYSQT